MLTTEYIKQGSLSRKNFIPDERIEMQKSEEQQKRYIGEHVKMDIKYRKQ